jgi:hypothetical protein
MNHCQRGWDPDGILDHSVGITCDLYSSVFLALFILYCVAMADLSKYALSLDPLDLARYKEKLTVTVDSIDVVLPDPYSLSTDWFIDPKSLPPTKYTAIYDYLIKTPGPFTGEAFEAYKSLEAYNYLMSGLISDVKQHNIGGNYSVVFVKASVGPGQRQNCPPYNPWICLDKQFGYVVSSHCTCMAGLGEACSHIAAVLFALDNTTRSGLNDTPACTSVKCIWADYYKKNVTGATAENLDLSHPRHGRAPTKKRKTRKRCPEPSSEEKDAALAELASILPSAAVLAKQASDTDTASEDEVEDGLPPVLYRLRRVMGAGTVTFDEIVRDATPTPQQILNLSTATEEQANSALWKAHRRGRITASNSHRLINCTDPVAVISHIMQYETCSLSGVPAIKWGVDNEPTAKVNYCEYMSAVHQNFRFENTGLVLSSDSPFIAASPDGLAKCDCHGVNLVEIKCPYKYRNDLPTNAEALNDPQFCLDQNRNLKKKHKYYCQIQTQLFVTKVSCCDLVVWTSRGMYICRVERDAHFIDMLKSKMDKFIEDHLIPELINRKLDYLNEISTCNNSTLYCICNRPAFGKMIACANDECMIEKFHYDCVNLKRKPRQKWYCPECST